MRDHITIINRRRMLADTLNACTMEEIRQETAAALHRKFPAKGHAVHGAAEIMEATQAYGQPPRVIEEQLTLDEPEPRGKWWAAVAWIAAGATMALLAWMFWSAAFTSIKATDQQVIEWRAWR